MTAKDHVLKSREQDESAPLHWVTVKHATEAAESYASAQRDDVLTIIEPIMKKWGAIPNDWRHFYQDIDDAIRDKQRETV